MNTTQQVYLSGVRYYLGARRPIGELSEVSEDCELAEMFQTLGLSEYCAGGESPLRMAVESARRTLENSAVAPNEVDAVIFASGSLGDFTSAEEAVGRFLVSLHLTNALPIGLFLGRCAKAHAALRLGLTEIQRGKSLVLVVVVDCVMPGASRIVSPGISIASDAAASFLLHPDCRGFEVCAISDRSLLDLWNFNPEENVEQYAELTFTAIREVAEEVCGEVPAGTRCRYVVTNNYNLSVSRSWADLLGCRRDIIYTKNIGRIAHAQSADALVALADLDSDGMIGVGEQLLLLTTGGYLLGASLLKKV